MANGLYFVCIANMLNGIDDGMIFIFWNNYHDKPNQYHKQLFPNPEWNCEICAHSSIHFITGMLGSYCVNKYQQQGWQHEMSLSGALWYFNRLWYWYNVTNSHSKFNDFCCILLWKSVVPQLGYNLILGSCAFTTIFHLNFGVTHWAESQAVAPFWLSARCQGLLPMSTRTQGSRYIPRTHHTMNTRPSEVESQNTQLIHTHEPRKTPRTFKTK